MRGKRDTPENQWTNNDTKQGHEQEDQIRARGNVREEKHRTQGYKSDRIIFLNK